MPRAPWILIAVLVALAACTGATIGPQGPSAHASTGSVLVTAAVPSATSLTVTGCASGASNITSFGIVQPGTPAVTSTDCAVQFGSTNDTSMLQINQNDRSGNAMIKALDGTLDTGFGTGGYLVEDIEPTRDDSPVMIIAEAGTGKMLVFHVANNATDSDILISRYSQSGVLDGTFGVAGRVRIDTGAFETVSGVIQNPDGSFWVYGQRGTAPQVSDAMIMKVTSAGALDTSFDGDGIKTYARDVWEWMGRLIDNPNGGGMYGQIGYASGGYFKTRLVKLTPNTLEIDQAWNQGAGTVESPGSFTTACESPMVDLGGAITCAGQYPNSATDTDLMIMRRTVDGRPDTSFSGDGVATFSAGANQIDAAAGLLKVTDKYLVAGTTANSVPTIWRFNQDGTIDTSFDGDGMKTLSLGGSPGRVYLFAPQDDGTYFIAGMATVAGKFNLVVGRLTSSFNWDTTFNGTGYRFLDISPVHSGVLPLVMSVDLELAVIGAAAHNGGDSESALVRLSHDSIPDYLNGTNDWNQGGGSFGACLRSVGGGATAQWTTNATCPASDGAYWQSIPKFPTKIAHAPLGTFTATANLRYGLRPSSTQNPGQYTAAIEITVAAPNV